MKTSYKSILGVSVILVIAMATWFSFMPFLTNPPTNLMATDTTYVGQSSPSFAFGTQSISGYGMEPNGHNFYTLMKFDLTGYTASQISSVKLYLYYNYHNPNTSPVGPITLSGVNTNWQESTVTWNTQPTTISGATNVAQVDFDTALRLDTDSGWLITPQWVSVDVTNYIVSRLNAGSTQVAFNLGKGTNWGLDTVNGISSRTGGNSPYLTVITSTSATATPSATGAPSSNPTQNPAAPTYTVTVNVKDQLNNPLPASVTFGSTTKACDNTGQATFNLNSGTYQAFAQVLVDGKNFNTTKTVTVNSDTTASFTINRQFLWAFQISYSSGASATGTLTLTGPQNININIDGSVSVFLNSGTYSLKLSTGTGTISLGSINVNSDQTYSATINQNTNEIQSTTEPKDVLQSGYNAYLLPNTNIYILFGILVVGLIIVGIAARRGKAKK